MAVEQASIASLYLPLLAKLMHLFAHSMALGLFSAPTRLSRSKRNTKAMETIIFFPFF
jgi:hypothetical protein